MPLTIGGGPRRPSRPPTHKALPFQRVAKLAASLEEIVEDGKITAESIDDLAAESGVGAEQLYAALATTEYQLATEHAVRFEVCAGGCQEWGALVAIERLVDARLERVDGGEPAFDVIPRPCLDQCAHAAAVIVVSPDGRALIPKASPDELDRAIADLFPC